MPAGRKATARSLRLGSELRKLRESAGLTTHQAAEILVCSQPKISRMETGTVTARVVDVRLLLDAYGLTDENRRAYLERLARDSNKRGWWEPYNDTITPEYAEYIGLETDSTCIRTWETTLVPGLLQTADYTRAVMRGNPALISPERLDNLVQIRQQRQERVATDPDLRFHAIVWEPVITAMVGSPEVHRNQLKHLLEMGARDNVTIQVLALSPAEYAGITGSFVTFSFDSQGNTDSVFIETLTGSRYLEEPTELAGYRFAFDSLSTAALSAEVSSAFISAVLGKAKE